MTPATRVISVVGYQVDSIDPLSELVSDAGAITIKEQGEGKGQVHFPVHFPWKLDAHGFE